MSLLLTMLRPSISAPLSAGLPTPFPSSTTVSTTSFTSGRSPRFPWEHIVSTDLVHWTELPTALKADGTPTVQMASICSQDAWSSVPGCFTSSTCGWNPRNPAGVEFIRHATSPDLLTWTKHPKFLLGPDGVMYPSAHQRDFRDPYVFWNSDDARYWMVFCSTGKTGVATSPDLEHWTLQPPLDSQLPGMGTPECPDAFRIGDTY